MTRIIQRHDTAANWNTTNPVLALGEMGVETDTNKFKFGNGTTPYNELAYAAGESGSGSGTILTSIDELITYDKLAIGDSLIVDDGGIPWTNPQMNSNSQDGYVASASAALVDGDSAIYKAFDKNTTASNNAWFTGFVAMPQWIMLECPQPIRLTSCMIMNEITTPLNFKSGYIQGSNDGINFDTLYTITNRANIAGLQITYTFSNNTYYKYLRVYCTESYDNGLSIQEIEFSGYAKVEGGKPTLNTKVDAYSKEETDNLLDEYIPISSPRSPLMYNSSTIDIPEAFATDNNGYLVPNNATILGNFTPEVTIASQIKFHSVFNYDASNDSWTTGGEISLIFSKPFNVGTGTNDTLRLYMTRMGAVYLMMGDGQYVYTDQLLSTGTHNCTLDIKIALTDGGDYWVIGGDATNFNGSTYQFDSNSGIIPFQRYGGAITQIPKTAKIKQIKISNGDRSQIDTINTFVQIGSDTYTVHSADKELKLNYNSNNLKVNENGKLDTVVDFNNLVQTSELEEIKNTKNDNIFDIGKFTIIGAPTITDDGVASGFSSGNYLRTKSSINFSSATSWEIISPKFKTTINSNKAQYVYARDLTATNSGGIYTAILPSGIINIVCIDTNWSGVTYRSGDTKSINPNNWYQTKIKFTGTRYEFYYKENDDDWISYNTVNGSAISLNADYLDIGQNTNNDFIDGSIDLSHFSITVDGKEVFSGLMDSTKPIYDKIATTNTTLSTFQADTTNNFSAVNSALNEKANLSDLANYVPLATYNALLARVEALENK